VHLTKIAPIAARAVLPPTTSAPVAANDNTGNSTAGGGASASCPLENATDPGNAQAPSGVPAAGTLPPVT